jgi:DNA-binding transcriptional LysR family regulator
MHFDLVDLHLMVRIAEANSLTRGADASHSPAAARIQVGNFEAPCRTVEAAVGVGVLPASAARRHAQSMAIGIVPLTDAWSLRAMRICVRRLEAPPPLARDLVVLLVADAASAGDTPRATAPAGVQSA